MPETIPMQTIIEITILLLLLYVAFFKSYFQEKGKNLATKEDAEQLTKLVEKVRTELQFSLQAKLSLRAEEHQALIDYFSKYAVWLSAITSWSAAGVSKDNTAKLADIRSQLDMLHRDFDLAAGKLELFVENQEIRSQHGPLLIETLKFQAPACQASFDIEKVHLEIQQMMLVTAQDKQLEEYKKLLAKESAIYKKHKEEQMEMYKALYPLVWAQQLSISKHIRALANS